MTTTAKAVRFDEYGGPEVLYVDEVAVPDPPAGEVLVRVRAAGINPGEANIRTGSLHERWPATFPEGEGSDMSGVVEQVGPDVTAWAVGDEVLGWTDRRASHAQVVLVPADQLVRKPAEVSWEVAGALFVAGATAWAAVRAVGAGPGDTVAVSAAAGGVGVITVQLLKTRGVTTVIGIASEANADYLHSLGVVPVVYGDGIADRLKAAAPGGLDAFIDTFGGGYVKLALDLGVRTERIDTCTDFAAADEYGVKIDASAVGSTTDSIGELAQLAADGRLVVPIAATYPLEKVQDAYRDLERRHTRGKIVLIP